MAETNEFGLTPLGSSKEEELNEFGLKPVGDPAQEGRAEAFSPRVRRSFTGELSEGARGAFGGLKKVFTDPLSIFARDIASTPQSQTLMGILQMAGSPMFALGDPSQALGDVVEQGVGAVTGPGRTARYAGNVASFGGDLAQGMALGKVSNIVKPIISRNASRLASPRAKALSLKDDLAYAGQQSEDRLAGIASSTEAAEESLQSIADAGRSQLPTASELRRRFAPNAPLGKESGRGFQQGWNTKFEEAKDTFEGLYGPLREEAASIQTPAANFVKAGGQLKEAKGVTGSFTTKPEGVAGRIPKITEAGDAVEDKIREAMANAAPGTRGDALKNIIADSEVPSQNATVANLIDERQRLSSAMRAMKDDNSRRQAQTLISALDDDIAAGSEGLAARYGAVNRRFATEYAPYFSKGSVTREIAQGTPERVVDQIYRPTVSASGRTVNNKSVEAMTRARELITDPQQWERINQSFVSKGIEQSMEAGTFNPDRARKWWASYKDTAGTGNEVLRKGLGERAFKDMDATFTQMSKAKVRDFEDAMNEGIKNVRAQGKRLTKEEQIRIKTVKGELERRISDTLGDKTYLYRKLESIGAGIIASGLMRGNIDTMARGGLMAVSARTLGEILGLARGRSAWRAVVRAAPGSAEAIAAIKVIQGMMNAKGEEENE